MGTRTSCRHHHHHNIYTPLGVMSHFLSETRFSHSTILSYICDDAKLCAAQNKMKQYINNDERERLCAAADYTWRFSIIMMRQFPSINGQIADSKSPGVSGNERIYNTNGSSEEEEERR